MPLRDHFQPPLSNQRSWEGLHGGWPMMIVSALGKVLPERYIAEPQVYLGSSIEVDVATYDGAEEASIRSEPGNGGAIARAVWAPPKPSLAVVTDWPSLDEYKVRVYDSRSGQRLVAAVEIVGPANKDRLDHRRAFIAKCAALLQNQVSVAIVDLVTTSTANLYAELMELLGQPSTAMARAKPCGSPRP